MDESSIFLSTIEERRNHVQEQDAVGGKEREERRIRSVVMAKKALLIMAVCVAVGVVGFWFGRNYLQCNLIRKSVADRTETIGRAKPWIADIAKQTGV